jgi:phosphotransferase system IIA component
MAKKTIYVNKDCVNSAGEFFKAKSKQEIETKVDQKLLDLKLVEEYDAEKHDTVVDTVGKLEKQLEEANAKIADLEKQLATKGK